MELIKLLLRTWKWRKLTLQGKISIIKTLALSKLAHLLIVIPNLPKWFAKQINTLFFKFLWNDCPDRIRRQVVTQAYAKGGLKMIDIDVYISSLKLSSIRRFFQSNANWQSPMNRILNRHLFLWDTGTLYKKNILQDPHINPFWTEIFNMWYLYADNSIPKSTIAILNEPIWYNNKLTNTFLCISGWAKHNVLKIKDLRSINGEFNFNHFKNKFNILGTFLDYNRILASIPQEWKTIIYNEKQHIAECTVYIPSPLKFLLQQEKGCKRVYNVLSNITNMHIIAFDKWGGGDFKQRL